MSKYFRIVAVGEDGTDEPVQYVGCYVLRWGKDDQPTVGFVPVDEDVEVRVEELEAALKRIAELAQRPLAYPAWQVADDSRRIAEEAIELVWPD